MCLSKLLGQSFRNLPGFFRDADARLLAHLRLRRRPHRQLHGPRPRSPPRSWPHSRRWSSSPSHRLRRHEPLSAIVRCLFRKQIQVDVLRASVLRLLIAACSAIRPSRLQSYVILVIFLVAAACTITCNFSLFSAFMVN
jgi:hypothetical protein